MTNMFGDPPAPPKPAAPPPTMPDPQSPDSVAAKRRTEENVMGRAGRGSTILSTAMGRGDAAPTFTATKLGTGA